LRSESCVTLEEHPGYLPVPLNTSVVQWRVSTLVNGV
jgi:hypothetical protein